MPIALIDILDERQIALELKSRQQRDALREIAALFAGDESVREPNRFLEQVIAREEAGSTLVEDGVAFPHARTEMVDKITLAIGRSRAGIQWNAAGERANLIFLLAVPRQFVNAYLVIVGTLARLTKSETCRQALLGAQTTTEFVETLRSASSL